MYTLKLIYRHSDDTSDLKLKIVFHFIHHYSLSLSLSLSRVLVINT